MRRFIVPVAAVAFFFLPLTTANAYYIHSVAAKICIYVILVAGLDLVVGYSGDVSVGHAGLFAVGAYTAAILMWKFQTPFGFALIAAMMLGAVFGLLLGVPALRLSGPYLAVTTIAFGLIIQTFVNEAVWLTKGSEGIREIPPLAFAGLSFEGNNFYYFVYPFMLLSLIGVHRLVSSYWGRAFEALKENSLAAECSGVSRYRFKLSAFVLSAMLAAVAGALFAHIDKYVGPTTFSLQNSILFLIALIFGGVRSIFGNILGTIIVVVLPDVFNRFADYQLMAFGTLLLLTLYFLPTGLAGLLRPLTERILPRRKSATPTTASVMSQSPSEQDAQREMQAHAIQSIIAQTNAPQNGDALLETRDLTIAFGGLVAVKNLNMQIRAGAVHALIGPNGSGKSTTVNMLSGVYRPTSGQIIFKGQTLDRAQPNAISRAGIARTFQNVALFGDMTVLENVLVGLHHTFQSGFVGLLNVLFATPRARREEREARARAQALLDFVGIGHLAHERARNLPYGKQRLLEIARALAQNPSLILLDEPAAGLTAGEIAEVDDLIDKLRARGLAVLLIEHHMDLVMAVSDEITVLDFGQKIAEGKPAAIQTNERVINAYLGTERVPSLKSQVPSEEISSNL
jgi:branched-chain amino acid transport system permease protein